MGSRHVDRNLVDLRASWLGKHGGDVNALRDARGNRKGNGDAYHERQREGEGEGENSERVFRCL